MNKHTEALNLALDLAIMHHSDEGYSALRARVQVATKEALAQPPVAKPHEQEPVNIAALVEGMKVSIDVSTGDHDNGNRLFGSVTLVQENQGSKHGLILLVQDPEANFKKAAPQPAQQEMTIPKSVECPFCNSEFVPGWLLEHHLHKAEKPAQPPVAKPHEQEPIVFCMHWQDRWGCNHYVDPKEPHPVNAKPLYIFPPQRTWIGLTDDEIDEAMEYWSSDEHSAYGGGAAAAEGEYFDVMDSWRYIEANSGEEHMTKRNENDI